MTGSYRNRFTISRLSRDVLDGIWEELDEDISPIAKKELERRLYEIEHRAHFIEQRERERLSAADRQKLISKLKLTLKTCRRSVSVMDTLHTASLNTPSAKNNAKFELIPIEKCIDALIETTETAGNHLFNRSGLTKRNSDKDPTANFLITELLHFWEEWIGGHVHDPRKTRFVAICFSKITGRDAEAESLMKRIRRQAKKLAQSPRCEFTGHASYVYCPPGEIGLRCYPPMDWQPPLMDKRPSK